MGEVSGDGKGVATRFMRMRGPGLGGRTAPPGGLDNGGGGGGGMDDKMSECFRVLGGRAGDDGLVVVGVGVGRVEGGRKGSPFGKGMR